MPLATITNGAPFSTKCRDSSVCSPNVPGPYRSRSFCGSRSRSNRSAQLIRPLTRAKAAFWEEAAALWRSFSYLRPMKRRSASRSSWSVLVMSGSRLTSGSLYWPPSRTGPYSAPSQPAQLPALKPLNSFPSGQGSSRMKFGMGLSSCPSCWPSTEPSVGRTNGGRGLSPRFSRSMAVLWFSRSVFIERTTASLCMILAQFGINSLT